MYFFIFDEQYFDPDDVSGRGEGGKEYTYFPRNPCEHWEGLSGAPAPSLRWANAGAGASLGWVRKIKSGVGAKNYNFIFTIFEFWETLVWRNLAIIRRICN